MNETPLFPVDLSASREALRKSGNTLAAARRVEEEARWRLREIALDAISKGMSEQEAERLSGISRKTLRIWQGKK